MRSVVRDWLISIRRSFKPAASARLRGIFIVLLFERFSFVVSFQWIVLRIRVCRASLIRSFGQSVKIKTTMNWNDQYALTCGQSSEPKETKIGLCVCQSVGVWFCGFIFTAQLLVSSVTQFIIAISNSEQLLNYIASECLLLVALSHANAHVSRARANIKLNKEMCYFLWTDDVYRVYVWLQLQRKMLMAVQCNIQSRVYTSHSSLHEIHFSQIEHNVRSG